MSMRGVSAIDPLESTGRTVTASELHERDMMNAAGGSVAALNIATGGANNQISHAIDFAVILVVVEVACDHGGDLIST